MRTYQGKELPSGLEEYLPKPHSIESFVQAHLDELPPPHADGRSPLPLRDYQSVQAARIATAQQTKRPGYALVLPTGSGKTAIAISATSQVEQPGNVLVVTKPSAIPAWRRSIDRFGTGQHRWVVINPEQLWRLFSHPALMLSQTSGSERPQLVADDGVSRVDWSVVVVDEAQILVQATSLRSRTVRRLTRDFTLYTTATPFTSPLETTYVVDLLTYAANQQRSLRSDRKTVPILPPADVTEGYADWLREIGLESPDGVGHGWRQGAKARDVAKLNSLLYDQGVGDAKTAEDLGLPSQRRLLWPLELSPMDRALYDQAWLEFRENYGLSTLDEVEPSALSIPLRKLQKASLVKVPAIASMAADYVGEGCQVVVAMFFVDSVKAMHEAIETELMRRKLPHRVVSMTGQDRNQFSDLHQDYDNREKKRQAFQLGAALVAVTNALEAISMHAGEQNCDGKGHNATKAKRVLIAGDVLTGGKRQIQAEGRTQRDGEESLAIYPYAVGTREEDALAMAFAKAANTRALARDRRDAQNLNELAAQLGGLPHAGAHRDKTGARAASGSSPVGLVSR